MKAYAVIVLFYFLSSVALRARVEKDSDHTLESLKVTPQVRWMLGAK